MKGVLFKYDANPHSPELRDNRRGCGLPDPDFWSNEIPVWAICGPYVRQGLEPGDIVFFLPYPRRVRQVDRGLPDFVCTGVLVVGDFIDDAAGVRSDRRLSRDYRRKYFSDLRGHLRDDRERAPRTESVRGKKIVLGDRRRSKWLCGDGTALQDLTALGMSSLDLGKRRVPYMRNEAAVERLYRELIT